MTRRRRRLQPNEIEIERLDQRAAIILDRQDLDLACAIIRDEITVAQAMEIVAARSEMKARQEWEDTSDDAPHADD